MSNTRDDFVYDVWYFAGLSGDIAKGDLKRIDIAGQPITLGRRRDGTAFALRDICPHRAAPLSSGRIVDDMVECPYHGWRFDSQGTCKSIPALHPSDNMEIEKIGVRSYHLREDGQLLWIYIPRDKAQMTPAIDPPQIEMAKGKVFIDEHLIMETHIDHAALGLIDPAHGPYVHRQWWWRSDHTMKNKEKRFEPRNPLGFAMAAHSPSSNSAAYKLLGGKPVTEITFYLPGLRTEDIRVGNKFLLSLTSMTPVGPEKTLFRQIFFTNMTSMRLIKPIFRTGVRRFLKQDSGILNLQKKGLNYQPKAMFVGDADAQARWYYAVKKEWAAARSQNRAFVHPVKETILKYRT